MTYSITVDWNRGVLGQPSVVVRVEMCQEVGSDALDLPIVKGVYDELCT